MLIKRMKGKALRKHSLHEKTAVSILLKLFINRNEWDEEQDWFPRYVPISVINEVNQSQKTNKHNTTTFIIIYLVHAINIESIKTSVTFVDV